MSPDDDVKSRIEEVVQHHVEAAIVNLREEINVIRTALANASDRSNSTVNRIDNAEESIRDLKEQLCNVLEQVDCGRNLGVTAEERAKADSSDEVFANGKSVSDDNDSQNSNTSTDQRASQNEEQDLLPHDSFSFFALGKPCSLAFAWASIVFMTQMFTYVFLLGFVDPIRPTGNPLGMPPNVSTTVRACQVVALVIAIISEDNIVDSIKTWSGGFDSESFRRSGFSAPSFAYWNLSVFLRFVEGVMAIVAVFLLVMQADNGRAVLLNFTAVQFVSFFDNTVFFLAGSGFFGRYVKEDASMIEGAKAVRVLKRPLAPVSLVPILLVSVGLWLWFSAMQGNGTYLCQQIYVQFGDDAPGLSHFSGLYMMERGGLWGRYVEYHELPHVIRDGEFVQGNEVPAKFGYSVPERAWVFSRGNGIDEPDLKDWLLRSSKSDSFDITKSSSKTWYVKKNAVQYPVDHFYLRCYDCDESFCGDHGRCEEGKNMCICDDGWYGLRCEFTNICQTLAVNLQSNEFPQLANPVRSNLIFPKKYDILDNISVYNRPVYVGAASYSYMGFSDMTEPAGVFIGFTGRYWEVVFSFDVGLTFDQFEGALRRGFHAHYGSYKPTYKSGTSDVDTATDAATPEGFPWFDASGLFSRAVGTVLACSGKLTDQTIRLAVSQWRNGTDEVKAVHGDMGTWDTSLVNDMAGLFHNLDFEPQGNVTFSDYLNAKREFFVRGEFEYLLTHVEAPYDVHVRKAQEWGGDLASIADEGEFQFLNEAAQWVARYLDKDLFFYWTGGKLVRSEEVSVWLWEWSDGTPWDANITQPESSLFHEDDKLNISAAFSLVQCEEGCLYPANENIAYGAIYKRRVAKGDLTVDISSWDVSHVTDTAGMFVGASFFNGDISGWATSRIIDLSAMFAFALLFNQPLSDWDVSSATSMRAMFLLAETFDQDLSRWDVSAVSDMGLMFQHAAVFNHDISSWDTSAVTDMGHMFYGAEDFNRDISTWDTSSVENMEAMFALTLSFNQDISSWNTKKVTTMISMFQAAMSFDQKVSSWDTSSVTDMSRMFSRARQFNQSLHLWDTSSVNSMKFMFAHAKSFNQDVSMWNTSSVTTMRNMFYGAVEFNHDVTKWNTSSVKYMNGLFENAHSFNQNISQWDTASVAHMTNMFRSAKEFNQDISIWNTSSVKDMSGMFESSSNFNQDISRWKITSVKATRRMFYLAKSFNQNLSSWDTSSITDMSDMFRQADTFNQTLCWSLHSRVMVDGMFCDSQGKFDNKCSTEEQRNRSKACN